jgi:H+-translocating NAD(P) transhydrogenase subunit beta
VEESTLIQLVYLAASVMFIFGLKRMSHPQTAVQGNLLGILGMTTAIAVALLAVDRYVLIAVGAVIGGSVGAVLAQRVQMTAMPQMVALFNGFGGAASVLVAGAAMGIDRTPTAPELIATAASAVIGAVTFWGSLVAFGKLQELDWFKKPFQIPGGQMVNALLAALTLAAAALLVSSNSIWAYVLTAILAAVLGVLLVNPIGGADMPVVIALLNSYSGLAAAATGFVINNNVLIISGALVGASGVILTRLMCKAMNRSLVNVLFGAMGSGGPVARADEIYASVRSTSPDDVAMILEGAHRVVIVPGYGLAVAQAQHAVRTLHKILEDRGCTVEYAIHPVAGRMPGHMNVLLAEADVPYELLKEMDDINPTMPQVDVAFVIGANDVVNPIARTDPQSPIAGMPIIDVDKARTVIVIKRSLSPGFAGIPNPLFAAENTLMLFADAQKGILEINAALREAGK